MKIGDKVKTTQLFAKEFAEEFIGVITNISTGRARMDNGEYHPTKIITAATIKTDTENYHCIDMHWLMSAK